MAQLLTNRPSMQAAAAGRLPGRAHNRPPVAADQRRVVVAAARHVAVPAAGPLAPSIPPACLHSRVSMLSSGSALQQQQQRRQQRRHRRMPASAAAAALPQSAAAAFQAALAPLVAQPGWDFALAAAAAVGAYLWVQLFKKLATAGVLSQNLSRKLVHSTAAPLFVLTWPLYRCAARALIAFACACACERCVVSAFHCMLSCACTRPCMHAKTLRAPQQQTLNQRTPHTPHPRPQRRPRREPHRRRGAVHQRRAPRPRRVGRRVGPRPGEVDVAVGRQGGAAARAAVLCGSAGGGYTGVLARVPGGAHRDLDDGGGRCAGVSGGGGGVCAYVREWATCEPGLCLEELAANRCQPSSVPLPPPPNP
jgi:hypothetical protein